MGPCQITRSADHLSFARAVAAGLLVFPLLSGAHAQAQKRDVSMRLDWLYQGPNAGFVVAKDKGFYDEAGLNVDIGPGRGSGSTAQLVASKAAQFGFADGFVVGAGVAKGMDIVTVGAIYRRNPTAVIVLAESDIKSIKDLEGKTIGIAPGGTQFQQWPAVAQGLQARQQQDPRDQCRSRRRRACAGDRQGRRARELRAGDGSGRGDPFQQAGALFLVRRLRRHGGQQRHHRAQGSP